MSANILIVEDSPEICELLHFSLSRAGFNVNEVETGEQALGYLDNKCRTC